MRILAKMIPPTFSIKETIYVLSQYPAKSELQFILKLGRVNRDKYRFENNGCRYMYTYMNKLEYPSLITYKNSLDYSLSLNLSCKPFDDFAQQDKHILKSVPILPKDIYDFLYSLSIVESWFRKPLIDKLYKFSNGMCELKANAESTSIKILINGMFLVFTPNVIFTRNETPKACVRILLPDNNYKSGVIADIEVPMFLGFCHVLKNLDMVTMAQMLEMRYGPAITEFDLNDNRINVDENEEPSVETDIASSPTKIRTRKKVM